MKNIIQTTLLLLIIALPLFAKNSLWEIKTPTNKVYLLGSIHLLKADDYPLDKTLEEVYKKADVVVFETNIDETKNPEFQQHVSSQAFYTNDTLLSDVLTKSTYKKLQKELQKVHLHANALGNFKPWFIAITLSQTKLSYLGFKAKHGLDQYFFNRVKKDKKEVDFFETALYQISLFTEMPAKYQNDFVEQTVVSIDSLEKEMGEMVAAWKKGDLETIDEKMNEGFDEYPEIKSRILTDRNEAWMTKIKKYLKSDKEYLIIVGAGHLPGKKGLLNLIKKEGYKAKQL